MIEMSPEQLHKLAECHLKDFVKVIYNLVAIDDVKFDLVIGAGNSGLVMQKVAELVFEHCEWNFPPQLELPIQRHINGNNGELYDNTPIVFYAEKQMHYISNLTNVLFVDDELGKGTTARTSLALMLRATSPNLLTEKIHCHIVVELRGWPECFSIPSVRPFIHHYPKMSSIHKYKVIVNNLRPPTVLDDIVKLLKSLNMDHEKYDDKCLNVALGIQSKVYDPKSSEPPKFTNDLNEKATAEIVGLDSIRNEFRSYLDFLIKEALSEASKAKDKIYL